MKVWFLNLWFYLRASYWFIPLVMAIAATFLSIGATTFDNWMNSYWSIQSGWLFINRPEGARTILATIAGSMITVAGVTFSMTIVAVSFAMGQIGPRLIHNFMRDRANQVTLGVFISTFLYSILVLRTVVSSTELHEGIAFVPHISILIAIVLAITSVGFLIFYIHHIPKSINIFNILAKIYNEYQNQIKAIFPKEINSHQEKPESDKKIIFQDLIYPVFSKQNGYIRYVDKEALFQLAVNIDCVFEIKYQPGTFVSQKTRLICTNKTLNNENINKCLDCFSIGQERDKTDDILFLSDEVIGIVARALSPGINAPFVAIAAIDWLRCMIEFLSKREISNYISYDKQNNLRIIFSTITFEDFVSTIFGGIRSYVSRDRNTTLYLLKTIKEMLSNSTDKDFNQLLMSHAEKLFKAANENLSSTEDKNEARELLREVYVKE